MVGIILSIDLMLSTTWWNTEKISNPLSKMTFLLTDMVNVFIICYVRPETDMNLFICVKHKILNRNYEITISETVVSKILLTFLLVAMLKKMGTYAGNDAIVAFAKLYGLNVVIHQLNSPIWTVS